MLILSKSHSLSSSFPLAKSQCQCLKSYFPVKETGDPSLILPLQDPYSELTEEYAVAQEHQGSSSE